MWIFEESIGDIGFSGPSSAAAVAVQSEMQTGYKIRLEKRRRGSTVPTNASLLVVCQFVCPPAHPGEMDGFGGGICMDGIYLCFFGGVVGPGR